MYSRQELADDFRRLGVSPGDMVMLHASIRAVGEIAGGPDQIHLALKDAITEQGTLMMYAGCPAFYDEVGQGHLTAEQERELRDKLPAFDAHTARAQRDNGALVELFRSWRDSRVNEHVARFVVWGRDADYLISEQPWNYAYGAGSPLERFHERGGKILLLGCDHDTVTFLHYAEHIVEVPGKRVVRFEVPVAENGRVVWRGMEEFDTAAVAHPNWPGDLFRQIVDVFLVETGNHGGAVGKARTYWIDSRALLAFALPVMKKLAEAS